MPQAFGALTSFSRYLKELKALKASGICYQINLLDFNLVLLNSLLYLDCGRKLEHPEETHANAVRMCKLHTATQDWN